MLRSPRRMAADAPLDRVISCSACVCMASCSAAALSLRVSAQQPYSSPHRTAQQIFNCDRCFEGSDALQGTVYTAIGSEQQLHDLDFELEVRVLLTGF